jgi:hypothetical protein
VARQVALGDGIDEVAHEAGWTQSRMTALWHSARRRSSGNAEGANLRCPGAVATYREAGIGLHIRRPELLPIELEFLAAAREHETAGVTERELGHQTNSVNTLAFKPRWDAPGEQQRRPTLQRSGPRAGSRAGVCLRGALL